MAAPDKLQRRRDDVSPIPADLDKIAITVKSHRLLQQLLQENPPLAQIMRESRNETEALVGVRDWIIKQTEERPHVMAYYQGSKKGRAAFSSLGWQDYAAIRILDYIDNAGMEYVDQNLRGEPAINNPFRMIWLAVTHGTGGAKPPFFIDMIELFRQLEGRSPRQLPDEETLLAWMERYPSGLDPRLVKLREENRDRILRVIIEQIEKRGQTTGRFSFSPGMSAEQKFLQALQWWDDHRFHLRFAARDPHTLNEMLGGSLDPDTMKVLHKAKKAGIPFFVNPYYLSLLHVRVPYFAIGADLAIRHYVLYSEALVEEFGHIVAWEKEDIVEPGKPNAAGWLLPTSSNVHRRYPEVAILIPDTTGRACGGLCASCQRMYNFQRGLYNFDLDKLKSTEKWPDKLERLMAYFAEDSQLRDVLLTGGDGLMCSDKSMATILDAIYRMAVRKQQANTRRPEGEKFAEIIRVRIGTRLPIYLPQRITPELLAILKEFREKGSQIGIKQFVIQTHFQSPMEVTPASRQAVQQLLQAGWIVTNQHVFTAASSRRGHTAKLRKVLNDIGVLPYYTFSVKGYMENSYNFATNGRAIQEQIEEKVVGKVEPERCEEIKRLPAEAATMVERLNEMRLASGQPFLATDRNVLNLPGVGKSLTFRVVGITRYGRRILEFDHDHTRRHSPIIHQMGKVIIIESKSIKEYLDQLAEMGEDVSEYQSVYGYSLGETEPRLPLYDYPDYDFTITDEYTNLELAEE